MTALNVDPNAEQIAYWNGPGGAHWTKRQEVHDAVLAPISEAVLARANATAGERVLDIGCGCGASSLELAGRVGASGQVIGVDISAPMLARARERAPKNAPVTFVEADATTYRFTPANADLLFSRFGVMFFANPAAAFANMRKAVRPDGRVMLVCWRQPRENPWLMIPYQAATKHIPRLPDAPPGSPGPFGFCDDDRVRTILANAGFRDIRHDKGDFLLDIAVGRGLDAAVETALEMGPTSRALDGKSPELVAAAAGAIREALAPFETGKAVPLEAGVWFISATAP